MKSMALFLAACITAPLAGTPFLEQLEERSSRFSAIQNVILMDIQEADNNQIDAFQLYAREVSKEMIIFGGLLQKSYSLVDSMRTKPSQKQMDDFKSIIAGMDSSITRLKAQRQKITNQGCEN